MKILVTGSTGMVGLEVVRQAITDNDVEEIFAISRKPLSVQHPKLKTVLHQNFLDYTGLENIFKSTDACLWCLGISQTQVTKEMYNVITYDYTVAGGKAILTANPGTRFLFLSGMGADQKEKSRTLFARVKGKAENALLKMNFGNNENDYSQIPFRELKGERRDKLYFIRPGGIIAVNKRANAPWYESVITPLMGFIVPSLVITSVDLAKVMLHVAKHGAEKQILENRELKNILRHKISTSSGKQ